MTRAEAAFPAFLDAFFWRAGIHDARIRALMRAESLGALAALGAGIILLPVSAWPLSFAAGVAAMAWIFWSWARFFSRLSDLAGALARALLLWLLRLALFALALCLALRAGAPAPALAAGLAFGLGLGLLAFMRADPRAGA